MQERQYIAYLKVAEKYIEVKQWLSL
jgi:hypothetical protein